MSSPPLKGKIALVTGASRGLGRASALALAEAGAHVLALARTVGALEELDDAIKAVGGVASLAPIDLTKPAEIDALAPALAQRFEKIDIFVGAAGVLGDLAPVEDVAPDIWTEVFDVNVHANRRLLAALDPFFLAAPAARIIVFTSRVGGEEARAFWGAYGASKAALEMLIKTYALERMESPLRAAIIDPGAMRTAMRAQAMPGEDPASLPAPNEIAPLVLHAASETYDGVAERLVFRDWKQSGRA